VGDLVSLPVKASRPRWSALVAAALVLALLYASAFVLPANRAYAWVSLDTVPGLELAVNSLGRVVGSNAVCAQGEELLASVDIHKLGLADAVQQLVKAATEAGLTQQDEAPALVTVTPVGEKVSKAFLQKMGEQVTMGARASLSPETDCSPVETVQASKTLQAKAKAEGLNPGQYAIALQASAAGVDINLDDLTGKNVVQALQSQGLNPGQLARQLHTVEDLDELMEQHQEHLHGKAKDTGEHEQTSSAEETGQSEIQGKGQAKDDANSSQQPDMRQNDSSKRLQGTAEVKDTGADSDAATDYGQGHADEVNEEHNNGQGQHKHR
jgi:hypothetical protein